MIYATCFSNDFYGSTISSGEKDLASTQKKAVDVTPPTFHGAFVWRYSDVGDLVVPRHDGLMSLGSEGCRDFC